MCACAQNSTLSLAMRRTGATAFSLQHNENSDRQCPVVPWRTESALVTR
uniref:Uncharacterized protein n=1 Tax=Anguilla anguilla TaxID=7936 RepID=A0A0E9TG63_ANGAN